MQSFVLYLLQLYYHIMNNSPTNTIPTPTPPPMPHPHLISYRSSWYGMHAECVHMGELNFSWLCLWVTWRAYYSRLS